VERKETQKRSFGNSREKMIAGILSNIRLEGRSDGKKHMLEVSCSDFHDEGRGKGHARKELSVRKYAKG